MTPAILAADQTPTRLSIIHDLLSGYVIDRWFRCVPSFGRNRPVLSDDADEHREADGSQRRKNEDPLLTAVERLACRLRLHTVIEREGEQRDQNDDQRRPKQVLLVHGASSAPDEIGVVLNFPRRDTAKQLVDRLYLRDACIARAKSSGEPAKHGANDDAVGRVRKAAK